MVHDTVCLRGIRESPEQYYARSVIRRTEARYKPKTRWIHEYTLVRGLCMVH